MSSYLLDGNKLIYHQKRILEFLETGDCYPIYMEISLTNKCNHNCIFCAYDYVKKNYKMDFSYKLLETFIKEISECGIKSVVYAGEGEPLLYKKIVDLINFTRKNNIDIGLFTNGQLLSKKIAEKILNKLTFIRFSFNSGNKENYFKIHKVNSFDKVIKNIKAAVEIKKKNKLKVTLGIQFVVIKENIDSLMDAVNLFKKIGVDYFSIKPYVYQNDKQNYKNNLNYENYFELFDKIKKLETKKFKVILRKNAFLQNQNKQKKYKKCYGTSFISNLSYNGNINACLPYWHLSEFKFGNIYKNTFKEIWKSSKRKKILDYLHNKINTENCPLNCRNNSINETLWELKNPSINHINFI